MENNLEKDPLAWEEIEMEHVVRDEWIDFRKSTYRYPDGRVFAPYYSYSRKDYVVVVAIDTDGNYICVRQFRQGIKKVTTEFVAGGIEREGGREYASDTTLKAEDELSAAKRELSEETGYESDEWEFLMKLPSNATLADNYACIFVAKNCRKVSGQSLDETEYLNVKICSETEIEEMIKSGEFAQAIHVLAWYMVKDKK